MKFLYRNRSPRQRRLVKARLTAVMFSAACICVFGFVKSAGSAPAAAASPSVSPALRRGLLASESSRSWTGGIPPPHSPVRDPGLFTKGRLQLEARSLRKAQTSPDQDNGGLESRVHPAIHSPRDEPIRVDGPLFDRSGRALRRSIEVGSDAPSRERSMRMHPAGKANRHGTASGSREKAASDGGLGSRGREAHDPNRSRPRDTAALPSDGSRSGEGAEPSPSRETADSTHTREGSDPSRSRESVDHGRKGSRSREIAGGCVGRSHTVRSGETLWEIAAEALRTEDIRRIARYWPRIHRHNRAVVGRDPSMIFPGQVLHLPPECDD